MRDPVFDDVSGLMLLAVEYAVSDVITSQWEKDRLAGAKNTDPQDIQRRLYERIVDATLRALPGKEKSELSFISEPPVFLSHCSAIWCDNRAFMPLFVATMCKMADEIFLPGDFMRVRFDKSPAGIFGVVSGRVKIKASKERLQSSWLVVAMLAVAATKFVLEDGNGARQGVMAARRMAGIAPRTVVG